jgi:hypothetical protein
MKSSLITALSIAFAFCLAVVATPSAEATDESDFAADTAGQLANLCSTAPDNPDYVAAIHFCEGFLVGAYRYHLASLDGPGTQKVVCLPEPAPSRDNAAGDFVTWLEAHPRYRNDNAVEAQFKWLTDTWPCRR